MHTPYFLLANINPSTAETVEQIALAIHTLFA